MSVLDALTGNGQNSGSQQEPSASSTKEQESAAMGALLKNLLSTELPDAIDLIMLGPSNDQETQPGAGFARYAARLFAAIGASRVRGIAAAHDIDIIRLTNTGTFWARFPVGDLNNEELSVLYAAEAAINRLLFVKEAFDAQSSAQMWTEADCALADESLIFSISASAPQLIKGIANNSLQDLFGTQARKGGEWDIRTRFALSAEVLRLPYRLAYSFDCNAQEGLFSIDYMTPVQEWMPQHRFDAATGIWIALGSEVEQSVVRYGFSVGVLLAAIAFGTSVGIKRVRIAGHPASLDAHPASILYFDRLAFISRVLPSIQSHNASWIQDLLAVAVAEDEALDKALAANHHYPIDDTRLVPAELSNLLYADTIQELDVLSDMPSDSWDTVHAAEADRQESPLAAIAVLESVVDAAEKAIEKLPDQIQPLYCSDGIARFLFPLKAPAEGTRFVRYSDAGFRARSILCDLYNDMGEPDRALQQAEKCIELAPTSTIGYTDAVSALFNKDQHAAAVPYLEQALALASQDPSIAFIYYRLAFALWQAGRKEAALASYVMCLRHYFSRPEVVHQEMQDLMSELGLAEAPSVGEAREILQREGIAPAPTQQLCSLVAKEAITLVDESFLEISAPLVRLLGRVNNHRDELFAVAASLES